MSLRSPLPNVEREFAGLVQALERNGDRSIGDLVRVIDKAWPKAKAPSKKKSTASTTFDPTTWVAKLRQSQENEYAFQTLLQELAKAKALKFAEVSAIANGYRSTTKTYRSKAAAVEEIRKAWLESQRDAVKIRSSDGIF